MNVLFLSLVHIEGFSESGIYPDLIREFSNNGHDIYVLSPWEKRERKSFIQRKDKGNIHFVYALIDDYFGVNYIKKGFSSITITRHFKKAIRRNIPDVRFDLVLYSTPPITFCKLIKYIKQRDDAIAYLMLKDIWPQGIIDIGVLSTRGIKGLISKYYKIQEKKLYRISDYIGCMSPQNERYLINNVDGIKDKVELCPNSISIDAIEPIDKYKTRKKYDIPEDKTVFIYGGNLGIAQGTDFILECLKQNENNKKSYIIIVGAGTKYMDFKRWFETVHPRNAKLLEKLPHDKYNELLQACDVGLIFLDHRFTIPNFPSRILSYMECKMPVLAATDVNTDIGEIIVKGGFGKWCESNDVDTFINSMTYFFDPTKRKTMAEKAYVFLTENYDVRITYNTINKHVEETQNPPLPLKKDLSRG